MTNKIVRFYDDLIIQPPESILNMDKSQRFKITDAVLGGIQHLDVTVAATHASRITRNNTLYLPTKMRQGLPSMLSRQDGGTSPSRLPIFINHNKYDPNGDPIGRITAADYIDLTNSLLNTAIGDSVQDMNMDRPDQQFYQFLDALDALMESGALYDPSFKGTGYIRSILNVTDEDAVKKFLDGRYVTVSTSFTSNKAVCSICRENWADLGEPCEHKPGKFYDKDGERHKCFLIPGDMNYDEISVAHRPGDDEAIVLSMEGVNSSGQPNVYTAQAADSYEPYELKWQGHFNDNFDPEGGLTMTREEMLAKLKELTPEDALDIIDKITDTTTNETLTEFLDSVPEDLSAKVLIEALGITVEDSTPPKDVQPVPPVVKDEVTLESSLEKLFKGEDLTDAEVVLVYGAITSEIDTMITEDIECTQVDLATSETIVVNLEDSKMDEAKLSELPKGTFCGPNGTFPITDAVHVTAARRMLENCEDSDVKTGILTHIDRKARVMGYGSKRKSADNILLVAKTVLEHFSDTVSDMERDELVAIYQSVEQIITEREILPPVQCSNCSDLEQQVDAVRTQRDELNETLTATRGELQIAQKDAESYMERLSDSVSSHRDLLKKSVASMRKLTGSDAKFEDICDEISDRTRSELENDYNELHGNYNFDTINIESGSELPNKLVDPTLTVKDQNTPGNDFDLEWVPVVVKRYQALQQDSKTEADRYVANMIARQIVPESFDINEHLSARDDD